jgi:hypothetical protein
MADKGLFSEALLEQVLTHISTYRSEFDSDESVAAH